MLLHGHLDVTSACCVSDLAARTREGCNLCGTVLKINGDHWTQVVAVFAHRGAELRECNQWSRMLHVGLDVASMGRGSRLCEYAHPVTPERSMATCHDRADHWTEMVAVIAHGGAELRECNQWSRMVHVGLDVASMGRGSRLCDYRHAFSDAIGPPWSLS